MQARKRHSATLRESDAQVEQSRAPLIVRANCKRQHSTPMHASIRILQEGNCATGKPNRKDQRERSKRKIKKKDQKDQ
jgi:hypothetical protein